MRRALFSASICLVMTCCSQSARAAGQNRSETTEQAQSQPYDDNAVLFTRRVHKLLLGKCVACHGGDEEDIQGGLDLRSLATATHGGDSDEPGLVVGKADQSPLYLAATRHSDDWSAMPPKESEALTAEQLQWLEEWINGGAGWPDEESRAEIRRTFDDKWSAEDGVTVATSGGLDESWTNRRYKPEGIWAYQPVKRPEIPASSSNEPIDYLLSQRRPEGLSVAPPANRTQWLRRATFDLTGLPPSPEDVTAFVNDPRDDAVVFTERVDQLLESPHYGERMAQHWLDVTRYADSSGFANDYQRGNAWRYRDYVVRSFNNDKPYTQFVREQIAGDEIAPSDPEAIVATGFSRMGPWELTGMEVAKVARQRFLDDVTNSVGETFLGHALQCARCHDHKFDPIPTQDYYSIQAVFATTQLAERKAPFISAENKQGFDEKKYLLDRKREHQQKLNETNDILLRNALQWYEEQGASPEKWLEAIEFVAKKNNGAVKFSAVRNRMGAQGIKQEDYPPKLVGFTPDEFGMERVARKGLQRLTWELERYQPFALAVYNGKTEQLNGIYSPRRIPKDPGVGTLEEPCILTGGDPFSPGDKVQPSALSVLDSQIDVLFPTGIDGKRTALADWIVHPKNPLTPRVIVNRIWSWHFGQALASNPNNFGSTGGIPTHPELLDYLASELVDQQWKIKALHRTIMLSDAYRRSTHHPHPERLTELDPLGSSYSVFRPRRLTAEELRDAALAATGELNQTIGGIPVRPEINPEVALQPRQVMGTFAEAWSPNPLPESRHRRSIYVLRLRGLSVPMFEVFNAPAPDFSCELRENSTVTPQVFTMWNSPLSMNRAIALALAVSKNKQSHSDAITECFMRLYSRKPTDHELELCVSAWKEAESALSDEELNAAARGTAPPMEVLRKAIEENTGERFQFSETLYASQDFVPDYSPDQVDKTIVALADVCLTLLNANEFAYLD
ncbi:MAG: PSD1 and planctomycete cytochrome C domain-containing protein [Aureliella sp.]